jgi:hypothetical protein
MIVNSSLIRLTLLSINVILNYSTIWEGFGEFLGNCGREESMPYEISLSLYLLLGAASIAALIFYALPKIELRGHSEIHNGIRVREVALTWFRGRRKRSANNNPRPHWLECVVYVTLKSCND